MNLTRYYIKKNNEAYFEVYPTSRPEVNKDFQDGEHFYRYSFGKLEFRNYEKTKYKTTNNTKLFDILTDVYFTDDFTIKADYNNGELIAYGYFGLIDGSLKNNKTDKIVTITPTTLDNYTNLIENYDTKIDVMNGGSGNKLANGNFELWDNDNQPTGWTLGSGTYVLRYYLLNSYKVKLYSSPITHPEQVSELSKSISNISSGSSIRIDFGYLLGKDTPDELRVSRVIDIKLIGTDLSQWHINRNGEWFISGDYIYEYASNKLVLTTEELSSISQTNPVSIITAPTPIGGTLYIKFLGSTHEYFNYVFTIIDNVIVRVNTAKLKTIKAKILDSYLKEYPYYIDGSPTLRSSPRRNPYNDNGGIEMYFDSFGAPNSYLLSDTTFAPDDSVSGLYLQDWIRIFDDAASSKYKRDYYKCQLSEVTVYECEYIYGWFNTKIRVYATAKFARDYAVTTTDNPPQEDAGWVKTGYYTEKGEYEWARKPFNTESTSWILGNVETTALGTFQGFPVIKKLSSRRNYPISSEGDIEFTTCIELRDIIKTVFNQTHSDYADRDVKSQFLWNDYPSEYPTFDAILNHVNKKSNYLNRIACLHTFDLKRLELTEELTETELEDSKLMISFIDLMNDLKMYFKINNLGQLYWFLTADKDLRIEHISHFYISRQSTASERELTGITKRPVLKYYDEFNYLMEEMPSMIIFSQNNSGYKDFKDNKVTFDRIVSGKRGKELKIENKIQYLTTDLRYCIENKSNLENGLILINYEPVGDEYHVSYGETQIQGTSFLNGNLSFSSLLLNFCRYEGVFYEGYINGVKTTFKNTVYNKEGIEIEFLGIITEDFIRTKIGTGKVMSVTYNFDNMTTKARLRYSSRFVFDAGNDWLDLGFYL